MIGTCSFVIEQGIPELNAIRPGEVAKERRQEREGERSSGVDEREETDYLSYSKVRNTDRVEVLRDRASSTR